MWQLGTPGEKNDTSLLSPGVLPIPLFYLPGTDCRIVCTTMERPAVALTLSKQKYPDEKNHLI